MKFALLLLFGFFTNGLTQAVPCADLTCDTTAIRSILTANGYPKDVKPSYVEENGRVISLILITIDVLPPEIGKITALKSISIKASPNFNSFPDEFWTLPILDFFILESVGLDSISSKIGLLKKLNHIRIKGTKITTLPKELGQIDSLVSITVHQSFLNEIPGEIGSLKYLQSLDIAQNKLTTLPDLLFNAPILQNLNLISNSFSTLPAGIGRLNNLITLSLSKNQLSDIPNEIGLLSSLQSIGLDFNLFETFPPILLTLKNLSTISLEANSIDSIPNGINQIDSLKKFYLRANQIVFLPSEIVNKDLVDFSIDFNHLCLVPTPIENWITSETGNENWKNTQKSDPTHYCDFTDNEPNWPLKKSDDYDIQLREGFLVIQSQGKENFSVLFASLDGTIFEKVVDQKNYLETPLEKFKERVFLVIIKNENQIFKNLIRLNN